MRAIAEAVARTAKTILQGKRELQIQSSVNRDLVRVGTVAPGEAGSQSSRNIRKLRSVIEQIVDPATRGGPMKPLRWVSKSLPHIVGELAGQAYSLVR